MAHALSPELHISVPMDPLRAEDDRAFLEAQGRLAEFSLGNSLGVRPAEMLLKRGEVWSVTSDIIQKHKIDLVVKRSLSMGARDCRRWCWDWKRKRSSGKRLAPY